MNIKTIDYFLILKESRSVTEAAKKLNISQPVLSRYLKNLEKNVGMPLLVRQDEGFELTEAGKIFLQGTTQIKDLITHMNRDLSLLKGIEPQVLKLGFSPYRGGIEIATFFPRLIRLFPMLKFDVMEDYNYQNLLEALRKGQLEGVINLYNGHEEPSLKTVSIRRVELLLVLPNYHPYAAEYRKKHWEKPPSVQCPGDISKESFSHLTDIPFVYHGKNTVVGQKIDEIIEEYKLNNKVFFRTQNAVAVSRLIEMGIYAGFLTNNPSHISPLLSFFHLPERQYLYSGIMFRKEHQYTKIEQELYRLEVETAQKEYPDDVYINDEGRKLLKTAIES